MTRTPRNRRFSGQKIIPSDSRLEFDCSSLGCSRGRPDERCASEVYRTSADAAYCRRPDRVLRDHARFGYRFGSRDRKRRVVTKVNWHPGVPYPDIGFMVAEPGHSAERLVAFCNHPGTADREIKDGMKLIRWTRPSWCKHRNYTLRLKLRALSDNPGNFI